MQRLRVAGAVAGAPPEALSVPAGRPIPHAVRGQRAMNAMHLALARYLDRHPGQWTADLGNVRHAITAVELAYARADGRAFLPSVEHSDQLHDFEDLDGVHGVVDSQFRHWHMREDRTDRRGLLKRLQDQWSTWLGVHQAVAEAWKPFIALAEHRAAAFADGQRAHAAGEVALVNPDYDDVKDDWVRGYDAGQARAQPDAAHRTLSGRPVARKP